MKLPGQNLNWSDTLVYDQIPEKLMVFPSAPAVLCFCQHVNIITVSLALEYSSLVTHQSWLLVNRSSSVGWDLGRGSMPIVTTLLLFPKLLVVFSISFEFNSNHGTIFVKVCNPFFVQ